LPLYAPEDIQEYPDRNAAVSRAPAASSRHSWLVPARQGYAVAG
jgi:hypothetical protein